MGQTPGAQTAGAAPQPARTRDSLLELLESALRARGGAGAYLVTSAKPWCHVRPRGHQFRTQGWKLHVATTLPLAETVLTAVLPVLLDAGCAFKFAATWEDVAEINSAHTPRGGAGKFLTVYPDADADAPALAAALHQATRGLAGPLILSDRPFAPGSLVHYRYGSFTDQRVLGNDGLYRNVVYSPAGEPTEDRREARFAPPPWAAPVFPPPTALARDRTPRTSVPILLDGRFVVREAIRHANKGGVYRAQEVHHGTQVVVKEARPHVAVTPAGTDARDALRAEARMLDVLAPLGISPCVVAVFEQGGHLFLAEELVEGSPLRRWVTDRIHRAGTRSHLPGAVALAERLVALLQAAHDAGVVVRDFNPNNLIVREDRQLRLLDLELAVPAADADDFIVGGTPGYAAPEQLVGAVPAVTADLFSLGATLCFVLTGADPLLPDDEPAGRPMRERLSCWLPAVLPGGWVPDAARELVVDLMDHRPDRRPGLHQAGRLLGAISQRQRPGGGGSSPAAPATALPTLGGGEVDSGQREVAVEGVVAHLLARMDPDDPEALWPMAAGPRNDPCNVQHGAAGVLGVLTRYYEVTGDERMPGALATACRWLERRRCADAFRPPGLYFGSAGIAWVLHDAGRALGDAALTERAAQLATSLPVDWPNPDLTHGTAGLGLTALHLWQVTGQHQFAERAARSAEALLGSAVRSPLGLAWQTPTSFDSLFAGERYHGFAHGTAGIGYFLLAAADTPALPATLRQDCRVSAEQAAETLLAAVLDDDGGARWCDGPGREDSPLPYWCAGSAGVGTFLLRASVATGSDRARKLADLAATSAMEHSWAGPLGQCHGVAGTAELTLDLAQALAEPRYLGWANDLAAAIWGRRVYRQGRVVFPDDQNRVSAEWAGGLSGVLAFLLRLAHGGPRRWMADPATWGLSA